MEVKLNGVSFKVIQESDAMNPRKEMDGWLGQMVCFHRRYDLGDEQYYDDNRSFLEHLATEHGMAFPEITLSTDGDLINYIKQYVTILPVYLYDHSGITVNTTGFSCKWDSGQVGWIYAPNYTFRQETGYTEKALFGGDNEVLELGDYVSTDKHSHFGKVIAIDGDSITVDYSYLYAKNFQNDKCFTVTRDGVTLVTGYAATMLDNEVKTYDQYLTGDVYGYEIKEDGEVIDSCWGFYGRNPLENGMIDNIDSKYEDVVNAWVTKHK